MDFFITCVIFEEIHDISKIVIKIIKDNQRHRELIHFDSYGVL